MSEALNWILTYDPRMRAWRGRSRRVATVMLICIAVAISCLVIVECGDGGHGTVHETSPHLASKTYP
jgi:hypothetical protein